MQGCGRTANHGPAFLFTWSVESSERHSDYHPQHLHARTPCPITMSELQRNPKCTRSIAEEIFYVRHVKKQDRARKKPDNEKDWKPQQKDFFDLPRELRDMVYHRLWQHSPYLDIDFDPYRLVFGPHDDYQDFRVLYDPSATYLWPAKWGSARSGLPLWLLTNKAFLNEGVAQSRYGGRWIIDSFPYSGKTGKLGPRNDNFALELTYHDILQCEFNALQTLTFAICSANFGNLDYTAAIQRAVCIAAQALALEGLKMSGQQNRGHGSRLTYKRLSPDNPMAIAVNMMKRQ